jgi:hypothetical protein
MRYMLAILTVGSMWLGTCAVATPAGHDAGSRMASQFAAPPDSARPWVYWFWMDGNITREGITADLEAMRRVGIGGVLIMEVAQDIPPGPVRFGSARWREMFQHAVAEATRLGLEVNMNNDAGWCGSGGPWIKPEQAMQNLVWTETAVEGPRQFRASLPRPTAVAGYYHDVAVLGFPTPAGKNDPQNRINRTRVVDLTARLDNSGRLSWEVPAGKWTVLRLGHTPTGSTNSPAPLEGRGLECDKLSTDGIDTHFGGLMSKLIADVGPAAGKTLTFTHIDSWEVHAQNWTPRMREEFQKRRGYDPLVLLPVMAGRTVDGPEVTARFLWDMRRTVAELFYDNYAGRLAKLAHRHGLQLSIEAYGDFPFDELLYAGRADSPMGEFWVGPDFNGMNNIRAMASAAHIYGKRIVGAEAFTSVPAQGKWTNHPFSLKSLGDVAFCSGINRFVFHRFALQPWLDRSPGMTMGPWGVHYERTETWWEQSRPWHEYLARCSYLLRQGLSVADLCYLQSESIPTNNYGLEHLPPGPYEFDGCSPEVVLTRMSVRDGRLVLPDGMSYRLLVLPPSTTMTPELLSKIKELVDAGATVIGPRPTKSPSLCGYPQCDAKVQGLAAELWGNCDGKTVTEHRCGKGRIIWGKTPQSVLAEMGVPPDFRSSAGPPPDVIPTAPAIRYIHRAVDGTDIFFVANGFAEAVELQCVFRVKGKRPEFWWPDTGRIEPVAVYDEVGEGTRMPIRLDPCGSVFVVFRSDKTPTPDRVAAVTRDGHPVIGVVDPTAVVIQKAMYGPPGDAARTRDVTARVRQFAARGELAFQVARMAEGDDPARGVVKTLTVEYAVNGASRTVRATDPETIRLFGDGVRDAGIGCDPHDRLLIEAWKPGRYEVKLASGKTARMDVAALPPPVEIAAPWELRFPPGHGAPQSITIDKLASWTEHTDAGVKYFSGTATYAKTFQVPAAMIGKSHRLYLDLGRVAVIAEVMLNGKNLGILWKPPFRVEIGDAVKAGANRLEVRVTNLWVNRLIGDEQLPADCKWGPPNQWGGQPLAQWPQWLLEGKPSPTGRQTFTTWRHWTKGSPLLESGLLGPVKIVVTKNVACQF